MNKSGIILAAILIAIPVTPAFAHHGPGTALSHLIAHNPSTTLVTLLMLTVAIAGFARRRYYAQRAGK